VGVNVHSTVKKPIPGIPADWLIVRSASQFAPTLMDQTGQPVQGEAAIKALFYPGRRVRGALSVFPWAHQATGRKGVSFNLQGVMDAGPGDRLSIGDGVTVNEFQKYATAAATAATAATATAATANPFAVQPTVAATANPFAQ
jgi:hypothetical protein